MIAMIDQFYYVASAEDEVNFRDYLKGVGLSVLPERPGGPAGFSQSEVATNPRRLLSLRPVEEVPVSYTNPYPHYSSAANPLLDWDVSRVRGTQIIAGYMRYYPDLRRKGAGFVEIASVYADIRRWMKRSWRVMEGGQDFIAPGAQRLIEQEGYSWSCSDPARTTVVIVRPDGREDHMTYENWLHPPRDDDT